MINFVQKRVRCVAFVISHIWIEFCVLKESVSMLFRRNLLRYSWPLGCSFLLFIRKILKTCASSDRLFSLYVFLLFSSLSFVKESYFYVLRQVKLLNSCIRMLKCTLFVRCCNPFAYFLKSCVVFNSLYFWTW